MKINLIFLLILLAAIKCDGILYGDLGEKRYLFRGNCTNYEVENVESEEDYIYPNKNGKILQRIEAMWEKYYLCLEKQANRITKPKIYRLIEGQFVEFNCKICPKPFQDYGDLEWKYKILSPDLNMSEPEILDLTPEMELTSNMSLKIFNVIEDFAGLYSCYQRKNVISVYLLEVSKNDTIEKVETSELRDKNVVNFKEASFHIHYKWTPWTECSSCGKIGRKFKYGTCYVSNKRKKYHAKNNNCDNESKRSIIDSARNSTGNFDLLNGVLAGENLRINNQTCEENESLKSLTELIERFESGIPCFSSYITNSGFESSIQQRPAIKAAVKHCLVNCPAPEIFEVLDRFGRVIEIANNSAGIYSALQRIPKPPPDVDRRSVMANFGSDIIIQCPSILHQNIPVTWKINKKIIFPEIIANESNGRFTIDLVNRIHLKKLRLKDNHIYSCWQREKLVGTVSLNVEKKLKIGFDHHVTLIVLLALVGAILLVGVKILTRELKY